MRVTGQYHSSLLLATSYCSFHYLYSIIMDVISLIATYKRLGIEEVMDHEKFNLISIDHHSTKLEGSTLTAYETQVLIDEGITPHGKPIGDTFMVTDHHAALLFTLENAREKKSLTVFLLQAINAMVLRNTGKSYNTVLGKVDARARRIQKR